MKKLLALALLAVAAQAHAEPSAAKKALIDKILKVQQPGIEAVGRSLVEQPAMQLGQRAAMALQVRVPPEKREAVARDIQNDLKKYVDETEPPVRERAVKLGPATIGAVLDEKFTEEELRQLVAILEAPVNRKFVQLGGEMQQALGKKLIEDVRPIVEPKLKALDQAMVKHLGISPAETPAKTPVAPAKK